MASLNRTFVEYLGLFEKIRSIYLNWKVSVPGNGTLAHVGSRVNEVGCESSDIP